MDTTSVSPLGLAGGAAGEAGHTANGGAPSASGGIGAAAGTTASAGKSGDAGSTAQGGTDSGSSGEGGTSSDAGSGGEAGGGAGGLGAAGTGGGAAGAGQAGTGAGGMGTGGDGGGGPRCGDGLVNQPDEECDDGNVAEGDACTSACKVFCPAPGKLVAKTHRCYFLSEAKGDAFFPGGAVADPCTGAGTHVAILAQPADVSEVRQGHAYDGAWVGARATDDGSDEKARYRWFEGPSLASAPWDDGEPQSFAARRCVSFKKDGGDVSFENRPCTDARLTLCVREPVCAVAGQLGVVDGDGHCFVSHAELLGREAAAALCATTYGGHLATFLTDQQLSWLGGLGLANHWVDARQAPGGAEPAGGWSWPAENGAPLPANADLWAGERPDEGGDADPPSSEDCAMLTRGRRLDDRACGDPRPALCEVP